MVRTAAAQDIGEHADRFCSLLAHADWVVRRTAVSALGRVPPSKLEAYAEALSRCASEDSHMQVRRVAIETMASLL